MHRSAGRNSVRLATPRLDVGDRPLPALTDADVEAFVDQLDLGAQHAAHQYVPDAVIDGVLEGHPAFLHEPAFHADLGGRRRHLAGVVGLHAPGCPQRIGAPRMVPSVSPPKRMASGTMYSSFLIF